MHVKTSPLTMITAWHGRISTSLAFVCGNYQPSVNSMRWRVAIIGCNNTYYILKSYCDINSPGMLTECIPSCAANSPCVNHDEHNHYIMSGLPGLQRGYVIFVILCDDVILNWSQNFCTPFYLHLPVNRTHPGHVYSNMEHPAATVVGSRRICGQPVALTEPKLTW